MEIFAAPDSLSTWLETTSHMDAALPALQVSWIKWNSGFRGSGLSIGDRIIAVNGAPFAWPPDLPSQQRLLPQLPGQYSEAQHWKESGAQDGQAVSLRVRRRRIPGKGWLEIEIQGALRLDRSYFDAQNVRFMGPGGPPESEHDGFSSPWSGWHEDAVGQWRRFLNQGPWQSAYTRQEIQQHLQELQCEERITMLARKYPGPFAEAMQADFEIVLRLVAGRTYPMAPGDLAYRELGEKRRQEIADAGRAARAAFLAQHAAETIPAFPSIDPILGNRASVAGKLVELPVVTSRQWIAQGERTWFVFKSMDSGEGQWYFAEGESHGMRQILLAERRYEELVSPDIRAEYAVLGRIRPEPGLVAIDGQGCFGLKVDPVAASVGDAFFVDLLAALDRNQNRDHDRNPAPVPFAGEEKLQTERPSPPPRDAPPEAVLLSFFEALKMGDEKLWQSLFVDWTLRFAENGVPLVEPWGAPYPEAAWTTARHEILDRVAGIRIVWVDDPAMTVTGKEFENAPRIEETMIEIDHLRLEDNSFRSFFAVGFHRFWTLQRVNDGPWKVTGSEGI